MATAIRLRRLGAAAAVATAASGAFLIQQSYSASDSGSGSASLAAARQRISDRNAVVPPRAAQESALIAASAENPLDILVVGGGATGSGVAFDAVTRGLRVGLVEREDFSSGTSSRSTKLIHGGLRIYNYDTCTCWLVVVCVYVTLRGWSGFNFVIAGCC